ncbi:MAG: AEC family transporter [Rubrivivax sp.]|nr:AEC family transporter [Rubrivivax sp.]
MQAILAVTVPFFALVLAGYVAARRHVLPESAIPGLNAFVLYFALPCMLFRFGNNAPVLESLNPAAFAVWLGAALLIVFVTVAFSLNARVRLKDASFGALVAAFPNTGFMGLPMLAALLGPAATAPVMTTLLVDLFVTSSLCIALAEAASAAADHGAGARAALARALRGAVSNPLPWAIALGALGSAAGFKLAGPVEVVVRLLADSATPVALFTIGAVLYRAGQHAHGRTAPADFVPVALVKLFLHPLLVFALGLAVRALGLHLTATQLVALTLAAALPSASNVSLLAERFAADNGRIARIILTSTVLAFASFSTLAWLFGVQPA